MPSFSSSPSLHLHRRRSQSRRIRAPAMPGNRLLVCRQNSHRSVTPGLELIHRLHLHLPRALLPAMHRPPSISTALRGARPCWWAEEQSRGNGEALCAPESHVWDEHERSKGEGAHQEWPGGNLRRQRAADAVRQRECVWQSASGTAITTSRSDRGATAQAQLSRLPWSSCGLSFAICVPMARARAPRSRSCRWG